jgi:four helix bundle protein
MRDQLNRAVLSVPNNIAEGNDRFTPNEKIHFFHIARGSAFECVFTPGLA